MFDNLGPVNFFLFMQKKNTQPFSRVCKINPFVQAREKWMRYFQAVAHPFYVALQRYAIATATNSAVPSPHLSMLFLNRSSQTYI